jgi:hypothetical protein
MIVYDRASGAYFAHKIGRSIDPLARPAQCDEESQRRRGDKPTLRHVLIEVWPMAGCVEPHVHRRLKDYHVENEYFDLSTPERLERARASVERCISEWPLVEERELNKVKRMLDDDPAHFEASCKRRRLEVDTAAYEERSRNETLELAERARLETERSRIETQEQAERARIETRRIEAIATADMDFSNRRLELRLGELTSQELLLRLPRRNAVLEHSLVRRGYAPLQAPAVLDGGDVVEYRLRVPTTTTAKHAKRHRTIVMSIIARAGLGPILPFDIVVRTTSFLSRED